jgi:hypothetical protein
MDPRSLLAATYARVRWAIPWLAVAGAFVCAGQLVQWIQQGAWPFHDSAAYYLAGVHLRAGDPVYEREAYLAFLYAPPWAVIFGGLSLLPPDVFVGGILVAQIAALRYLGGSWVGAGLLCWFPFVHRALGVGNIDLVIAAAILAGIRGVGWPAAVLATAKFSPALVLGRRRSIIEAGVAVGVLAAITLPWLHLWGDWIGFLASVPSGGIGWLPLAPRVPVVLGLLALRKPWALAGACALATPTFHYHSLVLLLPVLRLAVPAIAAPSSQPTGLVWLRNPRLALARVPILGAWGGR